MNAVKSDYEFFARFENTPQTKRQRKQIDNVQWAVVRPEPHYTQGLKPSYGSNSDKISRFSDYNSIPKLTRFSSEDQCQGLSRDQWKRSREREAYLLQKSREQERTFPRTKDDFRGCHSDKNFTQRSPFISKKTRIASERSSSYNPCPQITNFGEFICLSSEPYISLTPEVIVSPKKPKLLPPLVEDPVEPESTQDDRKAKTHGQSQSTKVHTNGFPMNERFDTAPKIQQATVQEGQRTTKQPVIGENEESTIKKTCNDESEDELIIVDSTETPISNKLSDKQTPANNKAQNNHVTSSVANEKPPQCKEISPIERRSPKSGSPTTLSPSGEIWSDYVITRVGSLLWLDKEVVYPITLDEMRRRIQDPENFSFQMLIAYVRHSRAKGRQFLDYWKCQPSGKTCRPNVLSKLCEADAKELVKGIHDVNKEYFPRDTLARNVATNVCHDNGNRLTENEREGKEAKDMIVEEKLKAIKKSR